MFLQILTRKYVYIWNLTCTWSDTIRPCQNIHRNAPGGPIKNFQNTLNRAWNEIRMKTGRKFLQNPNLNEINIDSIFTLMVTMPCAPEQPHFLKLCCVICSFHSIRSRNCTVFSIMIFKFHQIFQLPESCDFLYAIDDSTRLPSTTIRTWVVSMSSFPY